jgi:hypothetical protein
VTRFVADGGAVATLLAMFPDGPRRFRRSVLLVTPRAVPAEYASLTIRFDVAIVGHVGKALWQWRSGTPPQLVIADATVGNDAIQQICCAAAGHVPRAAVLVTADVVTAVPAALRAGCHAVLVRPFAPNLLHARIARLFQSAAAADTPFVATNRICWYQRCPQCDANNAVRFDAAALRRWWFACLRCDHIWSAVDDDADPAARRRRGFARRPSSHVATPLPAP